MRAPRPIASLLLAALVVVALVRVAGAEEPRLGAETSEVTAGAQATTPPLLLENPELGADVHPENAAGASSHANYIAGDSRTRDLLAIAALFCLLLAGLLLNARQPPKTDPHAHGHVRH